MTFGFRKFNRHICSLLLCLLLAACRPEADESHLEHVTPAHKPATYREAVGQLRTRLSNSSHLQAGTAESQTQVSELEDIIRWLPEIAADTDLRKAEWEQVQKVSKRLSHWLTAHSNSTASVASQDQQQMEEELNTLEGLIDASERRNHPSPHHAEEEEGAVHRAAL